MAKYVNEMYYGLNTMHEKRDAIKAMHVQVMENTLL